MKDFFYNLFDVESKLCIKVTRISTNILKFSAGMLLFMIVLQLISK